VKPLQDFIRTIPGYPRPGIMFRDVTTLFGDREGFRRTTDAFAARYGGAGIEKVAGIEARGFILGGALADRLGAGFVPIRKRGKLPADTIGHDYELEYGSDRVEIHVDAIAAGERVLLVDDLIATGGTALAGAALVNRLGGRLVEACFIVDLPALGGRRRLEAAGVRVFTLMEFEGE
jgi:adenine phosphoribosyltransferase